MVLLINSCGKKDAPLVPPAPYVIPTAAFDINSIKDTYEEIASFGFYQKWGPYNVHDPSIKKFDGFYYSYSTDVAYGTDVKPGIQVRKSKDLVEWIFVGWVFNSLPVEASQFIQSKGGTPFNSIWAPYITKWGAQYRLYYSLSSPTPRLSAIGLATSPDFQVASSLTLNANGTINNDAGSLWTFVAPLLQIKWSTGNTDKLIVDRERDWENKKIPSYSPG